MTIRKSIHQRMSEVAKADDRSVSWIANTAIEEWLARAGHQSATMPNISGDDGILQIED
jgi:predicted transcriptional regulator